MTPWNQRPPCFVCKLAVAASVVITAVFWGVVFFCFAAILA